MTKNSKDDFLQALQDGNVKVQLIEDKDELLQLLGMKPKETEDELAMYAGDMTSEQAAFLAKGALLGAGKEFEKGHAKCARLKVAAGDVWMRVAEYLERQENDREAEASEKRFEEAQTSMQERDDKAHWIAQQRGIDIHSAYKVIEQEEREHRWAADGLGTTTPNSGNESE